MPDAVQLAPDGTLDLRGLTLDPADPHAEAGPLFEALWLLAQTPPAAPSPAAAALATRLIRGLAATEVPLEGPGKLARAGIVAAGATVLARLGPVDGEGLRPRLSGDRAFLQPALLALLHATLEELGLSGLPEAPEEADALLDGAAALMSAEPSLPNGALRHQLSAASARVYLSGLAFCRHDTAWQNLRSGHHAFATIHREAGYDAPLDEIEHTALSEALATYIEGSTTAVFQYGLWKGQATQAAGAVKNGEARAPWAAPDGTLAASPPTLGAVVLTEAQAAWFDAHIDLLRDAAAAERFAEGVAAIASLVPNSPTLAPTAFHLFTRVHGMMRNRAESEPDGRLDYTELSQALVEAAGTLSTELPAVLDDVADGTFAQVSLPEATASWLHDVLRARLGSDRALTNLRETVRVWATGSLSSTGPAALDEHDGATLQAFVDGYLATWPDLAVFDFNKLGRMALAERSGDPLPLCQLNGRPVDPGRFHIAVAEAVHAALRHVDFPQPWMAWRFGYRARQCIELVDLLAEQQSRGLGPFPELFTGDTQAIGVIATTSDLFYNLLVFGQRVGGHIRWLYLDSEGQLVERREPEQGHRLFEAALDEQGHLAVVVPPLLPVSPRAYPIQNPYGLGDTIDVEQFDRDSVEAQTEKERFETRYRVQAGVIVGYDAHGNHRVELAEHDDGEDSDDDMRSELTLDYEQIRTANNPHYVSELSGSACSTRFRLGQDKLLAKDLDHIEEMARAAGVLDAPLSISEVELARRQKAFLKQLNTHTSATMLYPRTPAVDDKDEHYHATLAFGTHPAGDYLACERGVCRHMFIREHMGKQRGAIDERFASGAANTYGGDFRGLHIWGEVSLADRARLGHDNPEPRDTRYLSDATWHDPYVPLWSGAYGNDARRVEMYNRTNYRSHLVVKG